MIGRNGNGLVREDGRGPIQRSTGKVQTGQFVARLGAVQGRNELEGGGWGLRKERREVKKGRRNLVTLEGPFGSFLLGFQKPKGL